MSRILVAEDDPHILRVICLWLTRQGHEVHAVRNGTAALECIRQQRPDVVITDVNMPGLNGLELARSVLDQPECPRGIVLLTNRWDHRELGDRVSRASVHVVPKPFSPSHLAQLVEDLVRGTAPPAERAAGADVPAATGAADTPAGPAPAPRQEPNES